MKALLLNGYDGLGSLSFVDCERRDLGETDVEIVVQAASVNPVDARITRGYMRGRIDFELPHVLGRDCAGIVTALGPGVTGIAIGDEVYAVANQARWGTHAEVVVIDVSMVAIKPKSLDFISSASLPIAGLSALAGLVTVGEVQKGERILIHAGAGGVGSFAVQLAKSLGAHVAVTAGPNNVAYVRDLGADIVVDYTRDDFSVALHDYDCVFDPLGGDIRYRSFSILRPGGRIVHLSGPPMPNPAPRADVLLKPAIVNYDAAYLHQVTNLIERGWVRPTVSRTLAFEKAIDGYAEVMSGHARGKIVLDMQRDE